MSLSAAIVRSETFGSLLMKRRLFAKLLALWAGSASLNSLPSKASAGQGKTSGIPSKAETPFRTGAPSSTTQRAYLSSKPVNVREFEALAAAKLPKATFEYISSGSEDGVTLRENEAAFRRIKVLPPVLKGVEQCDLSTTALGQRISLPVILAPTAQQGLYHRQGELASARAAAAAGTIATVSTSSSFSVEEIGRASNGPKWFQLYVPRDKEVTRRLVQRAEAAGFQAIVVTVDLGERKDNDLRNGFTVPKEMLLRTLRNVGHTHLSDKMTYQQLLKFSSTAWDMGLTWEFFDWLKSVTNLPVMVKGVLTKPDALKAVSLGLDGIVVSNHGGRRLDGMPASIDRLEEIADAVAGRTEIYMDSGVRRGTDVLKALALGARAVLIGRAYTWALAADGEAGVRSVLEMFREEFQNAMVTSGCANVSEVDKSLLHVG